MTSNESSKITFTVKMEQNFTFINTSTEQTEFEESILVNSTEAYIVPVLFALIFVVGIIGNGTTMFIVARNKVMRNVPNIFIVSLAAGDFLLLFVSVPFTATIYTFKEWPYGIAMCKINESLQTMSLGISVFTLTVLSWDRYNAIAKPMQKATGDPLKRTCLVAIGVWVLSLSLAALDALGAHIKVYDMIGTDKKLHVCETHPEGWGEAYSKFHTIFRFLIYFALPIVCIATFYILMAITLVQSSKMLNGRQSSTSAKKQVEARKKVARVVLSFVIVFIICWLPRHVYLFWYHFDPGQYNMGWHVLKILSFCLCFINSCLNPMALYFLSRQFRSYFHKYLFCCCKEKRQGHGYRIQAKNLNKKGCLMNDIDGNHHGMGSTGYDGYTNMTASKTTRPVDVYTNTVTRMINSDYEPEPQTNFTQIQIQDLRN